MSYAVYGVDHITSRPTANGNAVPTLPETAMLEDIQHRVAAAVNITPGQVKVEGYQTGLAGWIRRSWGTIDGARFFAKIFLVDPYPIPPRFPTPGEELATLIDPQRPVEEQIAAEWKRIHEVRALVGKQNIPAPLGHSLRHRILVFEEVNGLRMDRSVKRLWPSTQRTKSVEKVMFLAGVWLRTLHEASFQGFESIDFDEVLTGLRGLLRKKNLESSPHGRVALQILEAARPHLHPGTPIRYPVALSHGDFALPNLLWQQDRQHLWVVDFEVSAPGAIFRDLGMMMFDLRKLLIYPMTSQASIRCWEESFWLGYGDIPKDLFVFIQAMATARIFYDTLSRISTWREQRGLLAGMKASLYAKLLEPWVVRRILSLLSESGGNKHSRKTGWIHLDSA